jgi:exonuclease III
MANNEQEIFNGLGVGSLSENFNFFRLIAESNNESEDIDIYNNLDISSKYYCAESFSKQFNKSKNCSLLSLNIQTLNSKFQSFSDLIHFWREKNVVFDVVCLQETNNIQIPSLFDLPNYHPIIYKNRTNTSGGGVAIYVHSSLKFSVLNELSIFHEQIIETLFLDIEFQNKKRLTIGNIYRSPSRGLHNIITNNNYTANQQIESFLEYFQGILDSISQRNNKAILCGDFNFNLLNYNTHAYTTEFVNMLFSAGYLQLISHPTRVSQHNNINTATLIDHIWTNDVREQMSAGVITTYLSDHFSTFCTIETNKYHPPPKSISTREFSDIKIELFKAELSNLSYDEVYLKTETQDICDSFHKLFFEVFDHNFPTKTVKFNKNYHMIEKWMTRGLLNSRNNKFKLQSQMSKNPTFENKEKYRIYKNMYNKVIKTRRKLYFSHKLVNHQGDLKKSWQTVKEAAGLSSNKNSLTDRLLVNGNEIFGDKMIGHRFNQHFSSIANSIQEKIPPTVRPPDSYLQESGSLFNMPNITPADILEIVQGFEDKKSCDFGGISPFILKKIINSILDPLCFIFNKSIETGIVPDMFKMAKVTPVFKKGGDPTNLNDYRPISLISIFSKILEKYIAKNLKAFLHVNNLIDPFQFGFQDNNSTFHPMVHLLNHVSEAMNKKEFTIGIFCDIRKAFDCVPKNTLLMKLKKFGVHGNMLHWFESYLTNRKQFVRVGMHDSEYKNISSGVPQGSILGPVLFLIFFNDLPKSTLLHLLLFCDDTTILASGKNLKELVVFVNSELQKISQWFRSNQMALHPNKTKFTIFYPTPSLIPWNDINIYFDDNEPDSPNPDPTLRKRISFVNHESDTPAVKFLGVFLDPALNFKAHINELNKKLSKSLFCLRRCKNLLTTKALKSLYYSIFHCHLIHGILIYTCASPSNLKGIFVKQKMAVRCIKNARYNEHSGPLFKALKILPLQALSLYFKLKFMYEYKNNLLPRSFGNLWQYRGELNGNYMLRNSNEFNVPRFRISLVERLPLCSFPKTWNEFRNADAVKNAINKNLFKSKLKKCLLDRIEINCNRLLCPFCHLQL